MSRTTTVVALLLLSVAACVFAQNPITYSKTFKATLVPAGTSCGKTLTYAVTAVQPHKSWVKSTDATINDISLAARVVGVGMGGTFGVASGQWNFLSITVNTGGLTGQIIPKGFFTNACGASLDRTAGTATGTAMLAMAIDQKDAPTAAPTYKLSNEIPKLTTATENTYLPDPRNRYHPTHNAANLLWFNAPFLPTYDPASVVPVTVGTITLDTDSELFPVCVAELDLRIVVSNCPATLIEDEYVATLAVPIAPPVGIDASYRGSFIAWRQGITTDAATVASKVTKDVVEVDVFTSWLKGKTFNTDALKAIKIEVFAIAASGLQTSIYTSNFHDYNPADSNIGAVWGKLGAVGIAGMPTDKDFRVNDHISYDTYVKSLRLEFVRPSILVGSRSYRLLVSGCCRPDSLFTFDTVPIPVLPAADISYSIEAIMTLESPQSAQFPRSSPELYVPPIIWLGGSNQAADSAYDRTAFGGFVPGSSGALGDHSFTISELGQPSLQLPTTGAVTINADSIVVQAKFLRTTAFSPSFLTTPPALAGTTARGRLVQTSNGVEISSTSYDFIVFRRQLESDTAVDETTLCNLPPSSFKGAGANDPKNPANFYKAYRTGNNYATESPVGTTTSSAFVHQFQFPDDKQCGNQLGVRLVRQNGAVLSKVYQNTADCNAIATGSNCALSSYTNPGAAVKRTAGPPGSEALWFLYNDLTSSIAPVYNDRAGAAFKRTSLLGLEVLAVAATGQVKRSTPVSALYPSGFKTFSREQMGLTYCYSATNWKCNPAFNTVAAISLDLGTTVCIAPASDPTLCSDSYGKLKFTVAGPLATRGTGYDVLVTEQTAAPVGYSHIAVLKVPAAAAATDIPLIVKGNSANTYGITIVDNIGCQYAAPFKPFAIDNVATRPITLDSITASVQPQCTAGNPVGAAATITFTYGGAALGANPITYSYYDDAGVEYTTANPVKTGLTATVTSTKSGADTRYAFTTNSIVLKGTPKIKFSVATAAGTYVSDVINVASSAVGAFEFRAQFPAVTPISTAGVLSASIKLGVDGMSTATATAVVSGGNAPYTYLWSFTPAIPILPTATTATVTLPAGSGGQVLTLEVSDSSKVAAVPSPCKVKATFTIPTITSAKRLDFELAPINTIVPQPVAAGVTLAFEFIDSPVTFTISKLAASIPATGAGYLVVSVATCKRFTAFPATTFADPAAACAEWRTASNYIPCSPYMSYFTPGTKPAGAPNDGSWVSLKLTASFVSTGGTSVVLAPVTRYISYKNAAADQSSFPLDEPDGSCIVFPGTPGNLGQVITF